MKYHTNYELLKDLPTGQKAGQELRVQVSNDTEPEMKFYFCFWDTLFNKWDSLKLDYKGLSFTLEQIQNKEFFKPIGKARDLILPFPSKTKIKEFYNLVGENRLVTSVDEVRLINPIFYSNEYYDAVYGVLKKMYNKKYGLS
jgi:hypothetical protein